MPAPKWFQKLRRRRSKGKQQIPCRSLAAAKVDAAAPPPAQRQQCPPLPAPCAVSPNRASYYFASADRARQDRDLLCCAADPLDVRVDVVRRRAGGDRRLGGLDAPPGTPELKLRPIVTRPVVVAADASESGGGGSSAGATTSAATTPSTRARGFHVKPPLAGGRSQHRRRRRRRDHHDSVAIKKGKAAAEEEEDKVSPPPPSSLRVPTRRRRWLYESLVVVKTSLDPERELAESMSEMVVANGIRSSEELEELLACYLALNAAEHHRAVVAAFRHVWFLLDKHSLLI